MTFVAPLIFAHTFMTYPCTPIDYHMKGNISVARGHVGKLRGGLTSINGHVDMHRTGCGIQDFLRSWQIVLAGPCALLVVVCLWCPTYAYDKFVSVNRALLP